MNKTQTFNHDLRLLVLILTMPFTHVLAQQFFVKSAVDSSAIPYVNVLFAKNDSIKGMAYSDQRGVVPDYRGVFSKVVISHVGYLEMIFEKDQLPTVVYLNPTATVLQEAEVRAEKKQMILFLGRKPKFGQKTSTAWSCQITNTHQVLVLIKNPSQEFKKIKSFVLYTKFYAGRNNDYNIKILFFENDNGQLGRQIPLNLVHKLTSSNKGKNIIDLENQNFTLPPEGYFVGIEIMGCADGSETEGSSPGIVFNIIKELPHENYMVERTRTTIGDWFDVHEFIKDKQLEVYGGYSVPAFGLEVFE